MMNTSVREHTAPQQHRKHGVEGKDPHTGPKAFVAMRHNGRGGHVRQGTNQQEKEPYYKAPTPKVALLKAKTRDQ